ncbi:MAG: glycosyltransferase [Patescibacteria group bacterium]
MNQSESNISMPLVSVIMPAYNVGSLISQTLESVNKQTFQNFEIIVVDDGSTDGLANYLEVNDKLKLIKQEHQGVIKARNLALVEARGVYIQFLDADDLLSPEKLARQLEFLESRPEFDLVYSDVLHFDSDPASGKRHYQYSYQGSALSYILNLQYPAIHAALFRNKALARAGKFNEQSGGAEDWDMWLRLAFTNAQFGYLPGDFSYCRLTSRAGRRSDNMVDVFKSSVRVFTKYNQRLSPLMRKKYHTKGIYCFLLLRLVVVKIAAGDVSWRKDLNQTLRLAHANGRYLIAVFVWLVANLLPKAFIKKLSDLYLKNTSRSRLKFIVR